MASGACDSTSGPLAIDKPSFVCSAFDSRLACSDLTYAESWPIVTQVFQAVGEFMSEVLGRTIKFFRHFEEGGITAFHVFDKMFNMQYRLKIATPLLQPPPCVDSCYCCDWLST